MKNKYLFLMRTTEFGGAERFQIDYFKFIDFNRCAVTFGVDLQDIFIPYLKRHHLPVELTAPPGANGHNNFFIKILNFYNFINKVQPNSVVFNQFWMSSFSLPEIMAAFFATKGNVYMVVHDCPPIDPKMNQKILKILQGYFTKKTIAVSKATRHSLVNGYKFPDKNVKITYHGVDVDINAPSLENRIKLRREFNISDTDKVILSTAMLHPGKRVDRLIEAFQILSQKKNDIQLFLVGAGSQEKKLKNLVESLNEGVKKRIRFFGFQENIPAFLQLSDIFVLPSDSEGLPLACLEAMSCGLITVVTDCGGPAEIIKDGNSGFLVEKSTKGVVEGLERVLNLSSEERIRMSHNAREFVKENFNLKKNVQNGLNLLGINNN